MIGEDEVMKNIKRKSTVVCASPTGEAYVLKKEVKLFIKLYNK